MATKEDIRARINIVDLISQTVKLNHSGKRYSGFCPFHDDKKSASFCVYPDTQTWHCFGACSEGGDVFDYIMKRDNVDFVEAQKTLAAIAGVELTPYNKNTTSSSQEDKSLATILEQAADFYHQQLLNNRSGEQARAYLQHRGLNDESIKTWKLGYAPDDWETLKKHLFSLGVSEENMLNAGLLTERESGGSYDRFRNRVMFPIRNARGQMAGFGARILSPNDVPKYLNSPKTPLFDKGKLLFGLSNAKKAIAESGKVIIVEGYMDVIGLYQAGFRNVVSPMGTALTEEQIKLFKPYSKHIILALDPDAAGQKATLRGLETARKAYEDEHSPSFNARGLLSFERRLQTNITVCSMPDGRDPDEIALENPASWQEILDRAIPIAEHVMNTLANGRDLKDAKVKKEIADLVLPIIWEVPNSIERDGYTQKLASLIHVDVRSLYKLTPQTVSRRKLNLPKQSSGAESSANPLYQHPNARLELHLIHFLLNNPEASSKINNALSRQGLALLREQDFQQGDCKSACKLILQSMLQNDYSAKDYVLLNLPDELGFTLAKQDPDLSEDVLLLDALETLIRMRHVLAQEIINDLNSPVDSPEEEQFSKEEKRFLIMEQYNRRGKLDLALQTFTAPDYRFN